jgi:hypothetical protein
VSLNFGTFNRLAHIVGGASFIVFALGDLAPGTGWNWVGWIGAVRSL